jgi:competence protein ComEC
MIKKNIKFVLFGLGILFFFNVLAWIVVFDLAKPQFLEVIFFDVGQGDAIFIETPQRHQFLIDGGPSSAILEKLGKEMLFWDRSIDLVILTHPEKDHLIGLIEVLKRYKIENILWTGVLRDIPEFKEWQKLIKEEKAKVKIAQAGQKIIFSSRSDFVDKYVDILHPFENLDGQEFKNSNNTSIISKLNFNEISFLFTGDAYESVEKKLLEKETELRSDVLKVGHHGSKTSTCEEFLEIVSPEIAIIQVGENKYGHPHPEVLERLKKFGTKILRTDEDGDIKIISDGEKILME